MRNRTQYKQEASCSL